MPKIIIDLPDDTNKILKKYAIDNGRSLKQFLPRYITACVKNSIVTIDDEGEICVTPSTPQPQLQPQPQLTLQLPAYPQPDYSHITSTTAIPPQSYADANTTMNTSQAPQSQPQHTPAVDELPYDYHEDTHAQITPDAVQITPDPDAGSIHIPALDVNEIKDYTQKPIRKRVIGGEDDEPTPQSPRPVYPDHPHPASKAYKNSVIPTSTDLEIEQVDNEWDAEGNKYSTEDFVFDLKNLEDKLREDLPVQEDPTKDPDYVTLKNYFIKHDLRERFRSLLSDPSRFYPEEGVYNPPQLNYARTAFRREKIDEDYIVALLSGTGARYRDRHDMKLYVDEE